MSQFVSRRRSAFTKVELVVALSVFGLGVMFLPIIFQGSRIHSGRSYCLSNMRQTGLAIQSYESRSSGAAYPGYKTHLKLTDDSDYRARSAPYPAEQIGKPVAVSWVVELFPYLDQQRLYDAWRAPFSKPPTTSGGKPSASIYQPLELFVCDRDPPASFDHAPISFVVNTGMRDGTIPGQRDYAANGVFHDHYTDHPDSPTGRGLTDEKQRRVERVTSADIDRRGDGLQYTMLLSENIDAGSYLDTDERFLGFTWAVPAEPPDQSTNPWSAEPPPNFRRINEGKGGIVSRIEDPAAVTPGTKPGSYEDDTAPYFYHARPSSNHPGGVNVVFCDAHGTFLSDKIDYYVYIMLMTPFGHDVHDPATGKPIDVPGFNGTIGPPTFDEVWIRR